MRKQQMCKKPIVLLFEIFLNYAEDFISKKLGVLTANQVYVQHLSQLPVSTGL